MKADLTLLYDEDCPLCRWYTKIFVKYNLLPANGRISYAVYVNEHPKVVDSELAQTKIACINEDTHEVKYGIDSLLLILGQRFRFIKLIGNFKPIHGLLQLLYLFISYNRKIIAPSKKKDLNCSCEPAKSFFWRIAFIAIISWITHVNVTFYFHHFFSNYLIQNPVSDLILLVGQIVFQWIAFLLFKQENSYDYLGHLAFTSFLGSLVLLFFGLGLQLLANIGVQTDFLAISCYGITFCFMFIEHKRRISLKEWSSKLSMSWILFRVLIYPLVFQF
ncbi:hypothetical protein [Fluviicola taffensis]|uniref:DUF393 domain-containing protein n=1 Tax=Fluviicola taffensis (strain DSM 16823 / NCIMB 13979 / RW262) TaxID=755732 RepID=F2IA96_FLUTR|nr:hypothetical protein [Fluviicola taffensis]AEA42031.1 hypothetical protein Fluta_0021 [Fluviicola taffensis DSM 16823]